MASLAGALSGIAKANIPARDRKRLQWQAVATSSSGSQASVTLPLNHNSLPGDQASNPQPPGVECPIDVLDEAFSIVVDAGYDIAGMKDLRDVLEGHDGGIHIFKELQKIHRVRNVKAHPGKGSPCKTEAAS